MIEDRDWDLIEKLQEGIPLCPRPFAQLAEAIGMAEAEFLQRLRRLQETGVIRRIGPRVRHHRVGIAGTIMVVWDVPPPRRQEVGELFATNEQVSHCYLRPPFAGFPYSLYTMIHARDLDTARGVVAHLAQQSGSSDYRLLPTLRELKKTSPTYRRPEGDSDDNQ